MPARSRLIHRAENAHHFDAVFNRSDRLRLAQTQQNKVVEDFAVVGLLLLAYQYPWIALPVFGGVVIGIAVFLPLLFRIARFLLAGLIGRVMSWFSVEAARGPVRVFARKVKGAPRLASGVLQPQTGVFTFSRWGRRALAP